jgi:hypothetical protein
VSLTSGRSGLASAVIYQPSMPGSYSQDCITNLSHNREYDDRGGSEGHEDDHDLMSRGNRSSYHVNLSAYSGKSGGQMENSEPVQCEKLKNFKMKIFHALKEINRQLHKRYENIQVQPKNVKSSNSVVSPPCSLTIVSKRLAKLILKEKFKCQKRIEAERKKSS